MKVAINRCYGGFALSDAAISMLLAKKQINFQTVTSEYGRTYYYLAPGEISDEHYIDIYALEQHRTDLDLITVIETLGDKADGYHAELKIVDVPDEVDWYIEDYDGIEWVAEKHRIWK